MPKKKNKLTGVAIIGERELMLAKIAKINLSDPENEFIYLERVKNSDNWRLTFTSSTVNDVSELKNIKIEITE